MVYIYYLFFIYYVLATGEPPFCLSFSVLLAIRNAIDAARKDAGNNDAWYRLGKFILIKKIGQQDCKGLFVDGPVTTERILLSCLTNKEQMVC